MVKIWSGLIFVSKIAGVTVRFVTMFRAHQIELYESYKMSPEYRNKPNSNDHYL